MSLTAEQLARRKKGVGASEVAAALGLSKQKSRYQLWEEKTGQAEPTESNRLMRFGSHAEKFILDEFEREHQVTLVRSPDTLQRGAMLAHLDALVPQQYVVQAKTASSKQGYGEPHTDQVPQEYLLQVTAEMLLANLKLAFVPVFFWGRDYAEYEVPFDAELADMVESGVNDFWKLVEKREPPEPQTLDDANRRYRVSRESEIIVSESVRIACVKLSTLREEARQIEALAEEEEKIIKLALGENEVATCNGEIVATWKTSKASQIFDSKSFRIAHPALYQQFMTERRGARPLLIKL